MSVVFFHFDGLLCYFKSEKRFLCLCLDIKSSGSSLYEIHCLFLDKLVKVIMMKKAFRIKDNKEFQEVFRKGKSFANRQLVVYYKKKPMQSHFRIGLSVGKKIGNAVTRNRIKRYLRQAFHELEEQVAKHDIVIIARQPTKDMDYHQVKKSLIHLLSRERLLKK